MFFESINISKDFSNISTEKEDIESLLQKIVNQLSDGFIAVDVDQEEFSEIEKYFESSFTLKGILENVYKMAHKLCLNINKKQKDKDSPKGSLSKSVDRDEELNNYGELERMLQKYEQEVREHIRIEQQLKLYADGLEEEVSQLKENLKNKKESDEIKELILAKDTEIERLKKKLAVYEESFKKKMKSGRYQSIPYYKKSNKSLDKKSYIQMKKAKKLNVINFIKGHKQRKTARLISKGDSVYLPQKGLSKANPAGTKYLYIKRYSNKEPEKQRE